ncbi:transcription-repair coupling factor [Candidatus Liberibacter americanus]|uniref:Transcription-repair-coupling factor n=1 Tax=Candidatus Liberibacter americanus str. Sao Paulo TaxID=1261131 RepID=U6B5G2_9HYPH|nr:transcription-repair coupling factor [Candidatus Liberibacter americanus]AHA27958.1 Transcription-repair coupling factor - superfamily II helicase [Candidatus Liberibacter americanus str. Sao Paulo]EMS35866.1 transcription-repair coupling factor [Candidatus Liberibacter americanus PW_SP]
MNSGFDIAKIIKDYNKNINISHVVPGSEAFVIAEIAISGQSVVYIDSDERSLLKIKEIIKFINPEINVMIFPSWDCLPYDRVSPSPNIMADRFACFSHFLSFNPQKETCIILTTVSALMLRSIYPIMSDSYKFLLRSGDKIEMTNIINKLEINGFQRVNTVYEVGEYAVRGGIIDVYVPSEKNPVRLDFFGDILEGIRLFDPDNQLTIKKISSIEINTLSEVVLNPENISRFRENYLSNFGAVNQEDSLYTSISQGRRYPGMEHWLPLFHKNLDTVFTYLADFYIVANDIIKDAAYKRSQLIQDYYEARCSYFADKNKSVVYKPILPEMLYLDYQQFNSMLENSKKLIYFSAFNQINTSKTSVFNLNVNIGKSWVTSSLQKNELHENYDVGRFDDFIRYINNKYQIGKKTLLVASSKGALQHLKQILEENRLKKIKIINSLQHLYYISEGEIAATVIPIDQGFETKNMILVTEKDLLGTSVIKRSNRKKSIINSFFESSSIEEGSFIVHTEHGIGQFIRLCTIHVAGSLHDCLELHYADNVKLFLPVENIDLISRYSEENSNIVLDKLGGVSWQTRKSQLKKRLKDLAQKLIDIAAKRSLNNVPAITVPEDIYAKFVQKFPYIETEDQAKSIEAIINDLASGHPMDRLICGDVGFGKTEVVLRAAFIAVMNGLQVVVIVPTTLLARQHFRVFSERFKDFAVRIVSISRFIRAKEASVYKREITEGKVDIIIGTHSLLSPRIKFSNLGLIIIDEEQHFGVKHKEALKETNPGVHVLTLSATPIPRTLQLAITGVRELSLINSPPIDRIPCRISVSVFDPLIIRETLMREHYRGGQSFYVSPRLSDLDKCYDFLQELVPELKIAIVHGKIPSKVLEETMNSFYNGHYNILLSTSIIESGLDLPTANTIIVHRADMFGLSQLYQLRGRVGRSKISSFALFLIPENKTLTESAQKRLRIIQSLDTLGVGFKLASHDLDIRGTGNILGEEQSGHIKEVGFELYQKMLEDTILSVKGQEELIDSNWSPQILIEASVLIPESYIADVSLRLSLYRRLGNIADQEDISNFKAEMIDRFGALPIEVVHLLKVVILKSLCKTANIEKMDIGRKGIVVHFRDNKFSNPVALLNYISLQNKKVIIRPDQSIVFDRFLPDTDKKFTEAKRIVLHLIKLIE